eukprot:scaffold74185_cov24-Prasinocladus_malaysianus.AAC.3
MPDGRSQTADKHMHAAAGDLLLVNLTISQTAARLHMIYQHYHIGNNVNGSEPRNYCCMYVLVDQQRARIAGAYIYSYRLAMTHHKPHHIRHHKQSGVIGLHMHGRHTAGITGKVPVHPAVLKYLRTDYSLLRHYIYVVVLLAHSLARETKQYIYVSHQQRPIIIGYWFNISFSSMLDERTNVRTSWTIR